MKIDKKCTRNTIIASTVTGLEITRNPIGTIVENIISIPFSRWVCQTTLLDG